MRLWHKDLIGVLPRQQLVSQWRECIAISGMMIKSEDHKPHMLLVDKVSEYDLAHFVVYKDLVKSEMYLKGYSVSKAAEERFMQNINALGGYDKEQQIFLLKHLSCLFENWHTPRYFEQCYYNLEEKYDCGGITEKEFEKIREAKRNEGKDL